MEALSLSTLIVALAEIGDKTQLLALLLAARFRKPWPIIFGILLATVANHALAAAIGAWVSSQFSPEVLRWTLGLSFFAIAAWTLVPDSMDEEDAGWYRHGAFVATLVLFFLAEIGDKTQVATVALAAQFSDTLMVIAGTTLGMLLANVPVVLLGHFAADRLPLNIIRAVAACLFVAMGLYVLLD
ncbi:TMEM165/GDT1 family protein [Aestuariirhabdus sp. Z084]|uniref:TMEM165/GDT1 family protein n=1 Tax=Aestuariirhabdus haliotis TaxID=2918751 RepID=UPI00201B4467|nr:TMEM165/GDT1 family protein [Aestuariirhabdus haliotis]MCL6416435.1 TMEM165/GDT1 family protein [Aestuariirhabdus haliotis]MCL6420399.1 TMEM165/GDT1 family protein [Aestuariirhabdus haliotis]